MRKIHLLQLTLLTSSLLTMTACEKENPKTLKIYKYEYSMGEPSKTGQLLLDIKYNDNDKIEQEVLMNSDSTMNTKTIYRYNSKNELEEIAEYDKSGITRKIITSYNNAGLKDSEKIYMRGGNGALILNASTNFSYNNSNKLILQKWAGRIDFFGEEPVKLFDYSDEEILSDTATSNAIFTYNRKNQIDSVKIYEHGYKYRFFTHETNTPSFSLIYAYDNRDSLMYINKLTQSSKTINKNNSTTFEDTLSTEKVLEIEYTNGIMSKKSKTEMYNTKNIKEYDTKGNPIVKKTIMNNKIIVKKNLKYNDKNKITEVVSYDKTNEPVYKLIYHYK